jgi:hypothetical protein
MAERHDRDEDIFYLLRGTRVVVPRHTGATPTALIDAAATAEVVYICRPPGEDDAWVVAVVGETAIKVRVTREEMLLHWGIVAGTARPTGEAT